MLLAGLLIFSLISIYLYLQRKEYLAPRYHLLCEVLKPGMSEDEVIGILRQAGNFTLNRAEWGGGIIELGINFTDPRGKKLYGAFDLGFSNYEYQAAYIRGFESIDVICDFHNKINVPTSESHP